MTSRSDSNPPPRRSSNCRIMNDQQVDTYVNRIGQKLAANAGGPQFQYRFKVVNASDINAFALPGGFVYINRGVIDQANNEGEVAGVIAHEISHVALRHGTHQASKAYAAQAGLSILGGILGGKVGGGTAQILNTVGGIGLNALFLKYSRDLESQADVRGSQILAASGYSPVDMVNFFHTLESVDKSKKHELDVGSPGAARPHRADSAGGAPSESISDADDQRGRAESDQSRRWRATARRRRWRRSLKAVPRQPRAAVRHRAAVRRGPRIAGPRNSRLQAFRLRRRPLRCAATPRRPARIKMSYPSNWKVYQEGTNGVTIAPQGGVGDVGGRTEVVYGAMINHYDPFGSQGMTSSLRGTPKSNVYMGNISLEDATNDLLGQVRQGSPYLNMVNNSTQKFNVSGGRALAVALRGTDPNTGLNERVNVVTRQLEDGHLIYMLFVTPEKDASRYGPVLQAMVNSLQVSDTARH